MFIFKTEIAYTINFFYIENVELYIIKSKFTASFQTEGLKY